MGLGVKHRLAVALSTALGLAAVPAFSQSTVPTAVTKDAPAVIVAAKPAADTLPDVADLADHVLPAVVEIAVETKMEGAGPQAQLPQLPDDSPFKDFFDDFLNKRQGPGDDQNRLVSGMGSGFIVDASGIIVTNNHVIENAESIRVHLHDGRDLKAELVGRDAKADVAVVRIKSDVALPAVKFGDSSNLRIGEWVMAIGNPFGLGGSVSLGIVSARNRNINAGPYDDFIQTDAAINKGNSGGPLFDMHGNVMGMNTAIFSPTGGSVGIGFSVPSNTVRLIVDQLVKYGETRRGWIGVRLQAITDDIAQSMALPNNKGALVADVTVDGPSAKAGLLAGDVILEFDGKPIGDMKSLPRAVAETDVGKKVKVKVLRKGSELTLDVELGRLEDSEKVASAGASDSAAGTTAKIEKLGMTVDSLSDVVRKKYSIDAQIKGVVVTDVTSGGAASDKKLAIGDVIVEAGGKRVEKASEVATAVEAAVKNGKSSFLLLVAKAGKEADTRFFALKLPK
jgi:serine protease Do